MLLISVHQNNRRKYVIQAENSPCVYLWINIDFSYHDYRDADISTYKDAVEFLINDGYKVIRFGATTNQRLEINSANYIDFSNQGIIKKLNSVAETIYSKTNKQKIAKVLDVYKPDIVHIHNYNFQLQ